MEKALERESQNWAQSENAAKAKEAKEATTGAQSPADGHDAASSASKPDAQWLKEWLTQKTESWYRSIVFLPDFETILHNTAQYVCFPLVVLVFGEKYIDGV